MSEEPKSPPLSAARLGELRERLARIDADAAARPAIVKELGEIEAAWNEAAPASGAGKAGPKPPEGPPGRIA